MSACLSNNVCIVISRGTLAECVLSDVLQGMKGVKQY